MNINVVSWNIGGNNGIVVGERKCLPIAVQFRIQSGQATYNEIHAIDGDRGCSKQGDL